MALVILLLLLLLLLVLLVLVLVLLVLLVVVVLLLLLLLVSISSMPQLALLLLLTEHIGIAHSFIQGYQGVVPSKYRVSPRVWHVFLNVVFSFYVFIQSGALERIVSVVLHTVPLILPPRW